MTMMTEKDVPDRIEEIREFLPNNPHHAASLIQKAAADCCGSSSSVRHAFTKAGELLLIDIADIYDMGEVLGSALMRVNIGADEQSQLRERITNLGINL